MLPERARQPKNAFQKLPFLSIPFREMSFFKGLRAISAEKIFSCALLPPERPIPAAARHADPPEVPNLKPVGALQS